MENRIQSKEYKIAVNIGNPISSSKIVLQNEVEDKEESYNHGFGISDSYNIGFPAYHVPRFQTKERNTLGHSIQDELDKISRGIQKDMDDQEHELDSLLLEYDKRIAEKTNINQRVRDAHLREIVNSEVQKDLLKFFFPEEELVEVEYSLVIDRNPRHQFDQDMKSWNVEMIKRFRFFVSHKSEDEEAEEYADIIKESMASFIFLLNPKDLDSVLTNELVCLIRDIITYAEDEAINVEHVVLFLYKLLLLSQQSEVHYKIASTNFMVVICVLKQEEFSHIFNELINSEVSKLGLKILVQGFKYYISFNGDDLDSYQMAGFQHLFMDIMSQFKDKSGFNSTDIRIEISDIIEIFNHFHISIDLSAFAVGDMAQI
ncbi:hypothetical protein PSN45_004002 [Yamadazyma tenuis]|nr:hypothetical protein PSN45_004002 [Yamadazyma tenuis]